MFPHLHADFLCSNTYSGPEGVVYDTQGDAGHRNRHTGARGACVPTIDVMSRNEIHRAHY